MKNETLNLARITMNKLKLTKLKAVFCKVMSYLMNSVILDARLTSMWPTQICQILEYFFLKFPIKRCDC